jgi:hypothetical protein
MNYYAQGGQAHGLKSLAQDLRSYGRDGDTILAHINPQEAAMLKNAGGSGTINPVTGLPEFRFFKAISRAVAAPFKAVNEVVKAVPIIGPAIDKGLVGLDKAVGNTIPGGWNTLAQTALAFTPLGLPAKVGLAALGGSGAFGPNGKFNLQRALMSGAMAYGANQLTAGLQSAGGAGADATASQIASNLGVEGASAIPGSQAAMLAEQAAGFGEAGLRNIASSAGYSALPSAATNAASAASQDVFSGLAGTQGAIPQAAPPAPGFFDRIAASDFVSQTGDNLNAAGRGIKNLTGFGSGASTAATNFAKPVTASGMTALAMGTMGTMQLDEQQKMLDSQLAAGSIAQSEYDAQAARIADARARAEKAVMDNPYQFASGGSVDDEYGMDEARGMMQGNLQKGLFGKGYAAGGQVNMGGGLGAIGSGMNQSTISPMTLPFMGMPATGGPGAFPPIMNHLFNGTNTTTQQDMMGDNRQSSQPLGSILGGLQNIITNSQPTSQAMQQPLNGNAYNSSIDKFSNSASSGGGGGYPSAGGYGGSQGAFPLQGQYGIVKMVQGGNVSDYAKGGEAKERRDYLDRMEAELRMPSAQYVEGMGFMTPPPSVGGRLGANFDALGGNIRAGVSGNAMMGQDRKIMARPEMMDIGYKGQVGPGELDVGLQRAIQSMPGRNKDYAVNAKYSMKFADGGNVSTEPRFLSGGGDGMSDSIPATINGRQEARLADGEFVIPADVVSHLGNGSSKAGAKRLYSMMDKVRSARTGMKKQAPAINTKKLMPA